MKKLLLVLLLLISISTYAQRGTYFKVLPPTVGATYAIFHAAALKPKLASPFMFFYWVDVNHQIPVSSHQVHFNYPLDSLVSTDTIFGLNCNQKYFSQVIGFIPDDNYESPDGATDTFTTLDTIGCTTHIPYQSTASEKIIIYPNPITSQSQVRMPSTFTGILNVYSITGTLCKEVKIEQGKGIISADQFLPGIYIYRALVDGLPCNGKFSIE